MKKDLQILLERLAKELKLQPLEITPELVDVDDLTPKEQDLWKEYVATKKTEPEKKKRTRTVKEKYFVTKEEILTEEKQGVDSHLFRLISTESEKSKAITSIENPDLEEGNYFIFQQIAKAEIKTEKTVKIEK